MKKFVFIRIMTILMAVMLLLLAFPAVAGAADFRVQVTLDSTGATSWAMGNIVPGDSGTKAVTLRNSGSEAGKLNIWVSNMTGIEGTPAEFALGTSPATGDLPSSLVLNISGKGLQSDFALPAVLRDFPQNINSSPYLVIPVINPGESIVLEWRWSLPASVGNEVQGDSVSFNINYGLSTLIDEPIIQSGGSGGYLAPAPAPAPAASPSPTPTQQPAPEPSSTSASAPVVRTIKLAVPHGIAISGITEDRVLLATLAASTPDNELSLNIPVGTQITPSNENRPEELPVSELGEDLIPSSIEAVVSDNIPPLPDGWVQVSHAYDINGVTNGINYGLKLDQPALIVLRYDENLLPEVVDALSVFYYNYELGWTQLEPSAGYIAEAGEEAAEVDHFSLFVILAKAGSPARPVIPAHFEIQKVRANPARITVGQSSALTVIAANTGGIAGEYLVTVKLDDKVIKAQSIILKPGEKREVNLTLVPEKAGVYTIQAGNLSDILMVTPPAAIELIETDYWWLLFIALGMATLLIAVLRGLKKTGN